MLKLGSLDLSAAIPRIAVGFSDEASIATIAEAPKQGVDIAEVRIDQFRSHAVGYVSTQLQRFARLPTIGTIRTQKEGGSWSGTERERLELFRAAVPYVNALDIELGAPEIRDDVISLAHEAGKLAVVSYHDFESTPDLYTLEHIVEDSKSRGADIVKIATNVNGRDDLHALSQLLISSVERNLVVIGMGGAGLVTRLFFPALGSLMTFAYIGKHTAPGQLPFDTMRNLMRLISPAYNDEKINSLGLLEYA